MNPMRLSLVFFMTVLLSACNNPTSREQAAVAAAAGSDELQVLYFHMTKRCATCNAVENETRFTLEMFFTEQVNAGDIAFSSLNLEEADGKKLAGELGITGQSLLLVKDGQVVNLTADGFMNARSKPDKFHEILKANIDKLL